MATHGFDPLFVVPREDNGTIRFVHARFASDDRRPAELSVGDIERFWLDWSVERYSEPDGRLFVPSGVHSEALKEREVYFAPRMYLSDGSHRSRTSLLSGAHALMDRLRRNAFEVARRHHMHGNRVDAYGLEVCVEEADVPDTILNGRFARGLVYGYTLTPTAYVLY